MEKMLNGLGEWLKTTKKSKNVVIGVLIVTIGLLFAGIGTDELKGIFDSEIEDNSISTNENPTDNVGGISGAIEVQNADEWIAAVNTINKAGTGTISLKNDIYFDGIAPLEGTKNGWLNATNKKRVLEYTKNIKKIEIPAFENLNGLKIFGNGYTISTKGDFHRQAYGHVGKTKKGDVIWRFSGTYGVSPIVVENSSNVDIIDLKLNGNCAKTTKEKGNIVERGHFGVSIYSCDNVFIKDLLIEQFATDGLMIANKPNTDKPTTNAKFVNITSRNHGRQGVTVGGATDVIFEDCHFLDIGKVGKYGGHVPKSALDVEPSGKNYARNVRFIRCEFYSKTAIIVGYRSKGIYFENCSIKSKNGRNIRSVRNVGNHTEFNNCTIDLAEGTSIEPNSIQSDGKAYFNGCDIRGFLYAENSNKNNPILSIKNTTLEGKAHIDLSHPSAVTVLEDFTIINPKGNKCCIVKNVNKSVDFKFSKN